MQAIIKAALKYFGTFILIYGMLTLFSLVPAVGSFFNNVYRKATEPILQMLLSDSYIQLKSETKKPDIIKVQFASKEKVKQQLEEAKQTGQSKASIQGNDFEFGFYNLFLSFFFFLFTLILLSPLNLKEKIIGVILGSFIFYLYAVFKMYLALLTHFNEPDIAIYHTRDGGLKIAQSILYFMTLGTNVLVVLVIWAALVFRKNNWRKLLKLNGITL